MIYFYIPVRDEQGTAGVLLYRLMETMRGVDMEYDVHLTLDGCTDDSQQVVEPYMKKLPLKVTRNDSRLGYGKCLHKAIRKVNEISQNPKRDYFMVLDADFSVDPAEIKEMAAGIERNVVLYVPDRLSMPRNRIGLAKRSANAVAARLLRGRGAKFPEHIDLLSTVRACRVQHLRRNLPRMEALAALPKTAPPAVSGALLYLALQDNSKKTEVLEIREQRMSRRKSRFSLFSVIRHLLFGAALETATGGSGRGRDERDGGRSRSGRSRRPDARPGKSDTAGSGASGQERGGGGRSRGGRSRRGRRSGGARSGQAGSQPAGQQAARQQSGKQDGAESQQAGKQSDRQDGAKSQQAGKQSDGKSQADARPGTGSSGTRSRRRRRRPNKRSQGSSNRPQDKSTSD